MIITHSSIQGRGHNYYSTMITSWYTPIVMSRPYLLHGWPNLLQLKMISKGHKFGKKSIFSECGHVSYEIKGNETYNNIKATILTLRTPQTKMWDQKVNVTYLAKTYFFRICLCCKLKGMERTTAYKHIFDPYTPLLPGMGSNRQNCFFLKVVILHIKFTGLMGSTTCKHLCTLCITRTRPLIWDQRGTTFSFQNMVV